MEPVRIKLYGLFAVTKRRYLIQQGMAVLLALCLVGIWSFMPRFDLTERVRPDVAEELYPQGNDPGPVRPWTGVDPNLLRLFWLIDQLPWIVGVLLAVIALETTLVLRKFARKEAEQAAAARSNQPAPAPAPVPETAIAAQPAPPAPNPPAVAAEPPPTPPETGITEQKPIA